MTPSEKETAPNRKGYVHEAIPNHLLAHRLDGLARVNRLPTTDLVWANPAKRPAQAAILGVNSGIGGANTGLRATDTALDVANDNTSSALDKSANNIGNALKKSSRNRWKALKKSATETGEFLEGQPK